MKHTLIIKFVSGNIESFEVDNDDLSSIIKPTTSNGWRYINNYLINLNNIEFARVAPCIPAQK